MLKISACVLKKKFKGLNVLMSYKCLSNNMNSMMNVSCSDIQSKCKSVYVTVKADMNAGNLK